MIMKYKVKYTQMGIKNLNSILKTKQNLKKINISSLKDSVIGVDFSLFLYRFKYNQNNVLECFMRQVNMFFKYNILPVYVLDGRAPIEKKFILDKRALKRDKVLDELKHLEELREKLINDEDKLSYLDEDINNLKKKCVFFEKDVIGEILNFFELCGIPVIKDNYECDWVLANLSKNNLIDYILSEDSDLLVFGGKKILRNFCIKEETANLFELSTILTNLELNYDEFVDMSLLCGCDYCSKIKGLNCFQSYELIKKYNSIENILEISDYQIDDYKNARNISKKEITQEKILEFKNNIIKKNFQIKELENFLNKNIEKKYLIPYFIKIIHNFIHTKTKRQSVLNNFFKKL